MASRAEVRAGIEFNQRVILLENDADTFEATGKRIEGALTRLVWTIATASLGIAINAVVLIADR